MSSAKADMFPVIVPLKDITGKSISRRSKLLLRRFHGKSNEAKWRNQRMVVDWLSERIQHFDDVVVTLAGSNVRHIMELYSGKIISFERDRSVYGAQVLQSLEYNSRFFPIYGDIMVADLSTLLKNARATMLDLDLMCTMSPDLSAKLEYSLRSLETDLCISLTTTNRGISLDDALMRQKELMLNIGVSDPQIARYGKNVVVSWGIVE